MGTESLHGKLMGSSQAVALLAVLAVSGVALLTFRKQKLLSHVYGAIGKPSDTLVESMPDSCEKQAHPVPTQLLNPHPEEKKVQQIVLKKVRFAPDVIEPVGDGSAYRGKNKKHISKVINKKACADKQEHHGMCRKSNVGVSTESTSPPIKDQKAQILAKPSLPANRLVLYKGIQHYRSMVTLDCRF
eukprot:c11675_g1_i1 orf=409-969(-)